tara:strand:- start:324 stop:530 length:207 start_codon:yes stop_codon:yes gene_type:complete
MMKDGKNHTRKELEAEEQRLMDLLAQLPKKRTRKWTETDRERDKAKRQLSNVRRWRELGRYKKEVSDG